MGPSQSLARTLESVSEGGQDPSKATEEIPVLINDPQKPLESRHVRWLRKGRDGSGVLGKVLKNICFQTRNTEPCTSGPGQHGSYGTSRGKESLVKEGADRHQWRGPGVGELRAWEQEARETRTARTRD